MTKPNSDQCLSVLISGKVLVFAGSLRRFDLPEISRTERRVSAFSEKPDGGHRDLHTGHVNAAQFHAVPDFHHDSLFHDPVEQVALAGKFRAQVHARTTPLDFFSMSRKSGAKLEAAICQETTVANNYTPKKPE